ncbi:zinc finger protein 354A isoform X1 [Manduca sexta]|uniref:zinc finger protein 354A isoform X1 n=1 Tax=Manduca sexta TaxID=7130 RepID=UPI00188E7D57|nr:zinc finger protein 354A isoform X1 [Manduca sexta]
MPAFYCRFCAELKAAQEVIHFSKPSRHEILEKIITMKIDFVDLTDKLLPAIICNICLSTLNRFYSFIVKARNSQNVLSNIFSNERPMDSDNNSDNFADDCSVVLGDSLSRLDDKSNKQTLKFQPSPWDLYFWLCGHCHLRFSSLSSVRSHCIADHGVCCSWQCADCLERVDEYELFIRHIQTHNSEMLNYCEQCNVKLENGHTHSAIDHPMCKYCGDIFESRELLLHHQNKYQNGKVTLAETSLSLENQCKESWSSYKWACKYCDMIMSSQKLLRYHSKLVHGKCFGMKCADCDISSTNFVQFVDHVRMHRENLRYYCPYCDIPLTDETHLKQHTVDSINCNSCGELFQSQRDLCEHISTVKEDIKITYKTRKSKSIKKIEKVITEEDLICNFCGKRTKSLKSLRLHMKRHSDRNRNYTCDRCGKTFLTKSTLSAHIIIHENPDPEVCKICKKTFLTLTRLKKHVKLITTNDRFAAKCVINALGLKSI